MREGALHQFDEEVAQVYRVGRANWDLRIGRIKRNLNGIRLHKSNQSSEEKALILET